MLYGNCLFLDTRINPAETGFYYLGSRYYDPEVGRFLNADTTDVLTLNCAGLSEKNLFTYCNNNLICFKDVLGTMAETAFDIATLAWSAVEVTMNPTDLTAWAALMGDAVDLIPFVTGVGETIKALRTSSKIAEGTADAIDTYGNLRKNNKGLGKEVHHIEKRFADSLNLGSESKMLSIALDKKVHKGYTKAWREILKYGKKYNDVQVVKAAAQVYSNNPRLMGTVIYSLVK
ncbi:MAG: hypothetical protein E7253_07180 [Lachnospiraceae bacterium]|nr:hypothetical protein [Lachnospiraceae bacterium]